MVASANTICSFTVSTFPQEQASLNVEPERAPSRSSATVISTLRERNTHGERLKHLERDKKTERRRESHTLRERHKHTESHTH